MTQCWTMRKLIRVKIKNEVFKTTLHYLPQIVFSHSLIYKWLLKFKFMTENLNMSLCKVFKPKYFIKWVRMLTVSRLFIWFNFSPIISVALILLKNIGLSTVLYSASQPSLF